MQKSGNLYLRTHKENSVRELRTRKLAPIEKERTITVVATAICEELVCVSDRAVPD